MKANELMIGDWVRIKTGLKDAYWMPYDMSEGSFLKVEEILCNGINPDWIGGEINDYIPEDAIEPILLTPEILEKNGFLRTQYYGELLIQDWHIQSDCKGLRAGSVKGWYLHIQCEYVHELQHALKLCGIDKEIIL